MMRRGVAAREAAATSMVAPTNAITATLITLFIINSRLRAGALAFAPLIINSGCALTRLHSLRSLFPLLGKHKRVQSAATAEEQILPAVEFVGYRSISNAADSRVPQRCSISGSKCKDVARIVTGESQAGLRRQSARRARPFPEKMVPPDLARLIVD